MATAKERADKAKAERDMNTMIREYRMWAWRNRIIDSADAEIEGEYTFKAWKHAWECAWEKSMHRHLALGDYRAREKLRIAEKMRRALPDEDLKKMWIETGNGKDFARAIEKKHKIK